MGENPQCRCGWGAAVDQFEFFFAFFGLLLGLALAELLNGFAAILREKVRPRWGVITPLLGVLVVIEIAATFVDAWLKLKSVEINLVGFAIPGLIGIAYYVVAVMAVPRHAEDWVCLDDYFYARRHWIVGLLIAANIGHVALELPTLAPRFQAEDVLLVRYLVFNSVLFGSYIALLVAKKRRLSISALAMLLIYFANSYGLKIV